ncbi:MAG TPA: SRPBCC family protein [Solirubrobacterales bacterium]|nr:SRPBCC family protein [Solirubrobacterales bacterium]
MSERETPNKLTVTTPAEREIHTERVFDAPRERVFAAHLDPELIPQWWGPRGTTTVVEELDPRRGGRWCFAMEDPDGGRTLFRGYFREVAEPDRIVQTFEWDGMPGHVSVETATFEDLGDGRTRVRGVSVFHTIDERDGMIGSGMEKGMAETYDRLEELLTSS